MTGSEQEQNLSQQGVQGTLISAIKAAKSGNKGQAYHLLLQVVAADPSNETAWFWLAGITDRPGEALSALDHIEQLNPNHPQLATARRWVQARLTSATGHPQRRSPDSPAGRTQAVQLPSRDSQRGAPAGASLPQPVPVPFTSALAWPRRLLVVLAGMGAVLTAGVLAMAVWVQVGAAQTAPLASPTPDNSQRVLALQPELNAALTESRWEDAIAIFQVMRALDPANLALGRELASVYYQLGMERRDRGDLEGAVAALDESLMLAPGDSQTQQDRRLLAAYHQGVQFHQAGDWQAAIRALAPVYREVPTYLDVVELLYSTYYNLGLSQQAAGDLVGARSSYQAAVDLMPDEPLAREKADEVAWLLRPPTPTPVPTPLPTPTPTPVPNPQRIVIDISEQRMYVYKGDALLWKWVVSTGEPGRATAIGEFAVQSKIDVAYASTWNLDMPYWLGIYWSGPLENGIHALPIQRATGHKLWDGYLGQRVSYGCVILSDENARTLFHWAEMGTPVTIQP